MCQVLLVVFYSVIFRSWIWNVTLDKIISTDSIIFFCIHSFYQPKNCGTLMSWPRKEERDCFLVKSGGRMHGGHLVSFVDHVFIQTSVESFICFFNLPIVKLCSYLDIWWQLFIQIIQCLSQSWYSGDQARVSMGTVMPILSFHLAQKVEAWGWAWWSTCWALPRVTSWMDATGTVATYVSHPGSFIPL